MVWKQFKNKENNNTKTVENNNKLEGNDIQNSLKEISMEDKNVQELYTLYNLKANIAIKEVETFLNVKEETINSKDLSNTLKNYFGYRYQIEEKKEKNESCNEYRSLNQEMWNSCEGIENVQTKVFANNDLEIAVKELFGSYKAETFNTGPCTRYYFDQTRNKYVYQIEECGGVSPIVANKIASAYKSNDILEINVKYAPEFLMDYDEPKENDYNYNFKYTFEIKENNYIFKSLEKTKIK